MLDLILSLLYSGFSVLVAYSTEDEILENLLREEAGYIEQVFRDEITYELRKVQRRVFLFQLSL